MTEDAEVTGSSAITEMTADQVGKDVLGRLIVGAIAGGLTLIFGSDVRMVLAGSDEACGAGEQYEAVLAGIISAAFGLFWLIRTQVFRPLLVVIAVTIGLWGIGLLMLHWPWYALVGVTAVLHGIAYGLFAWISRVRVFWVVVILLV